MASRRHWQLWASSAAIGLLGILLVLRTQSGMAHLGLYSPLPTPPVVRGRNNTVLFLTNEEAGMCNVHVATAAALVERHPEIEVHFASFPALAGRIARASDLALDARSNRGGRDGSGDDIGNGIIYHNLTSVPGSQDKIMPGEHWDFLHRPGVTGVKAMLFAVTKALVPWPGREYLALYQECSRLIEDEVDPAVVVLDTMFSPGREAARKLHRTHAFISPNNMIDNFLSMQPWAGALWKFPA
jgi:hypothetical protein